MKFDALKNPFEHLRRRLRARRFVHLRQRLTARLQERLERSSRLDAHRLPLERR